MKGNIVGGLAVTALLIIAPLSAASAADMPLKAPPPAPAPVWSWTGFYLGGELGYRWDRDTWNTTSVVDPTCALCTGAPFPPGPANSAQFSPNSFRGGVYLGYNWQINSLWVVGLEGDYAGANKTATQATIPGTVGVATPGFTALGVGDTSSIKDTWDAGIRGRLGVLVSPNVLLFGTTGASWLGQRATATCGLVGFPTSWCGNASNLGNPSSVSHTSVGWEGGVGVETMVAASWLLRAEYRYTAYGSWNATLLSGGAEPGLDAVNAHFKTNTNTVLAGVAYKFGGPAR